MTIQLSTKERMLLQDQKSQEELCVQKYNSYASIAKDPQLSELFSSLGQKEETHLTYINQILSGQIPNIGMAGSSSQQQTEQKPMQAAMQSGLFGMSMQNSPNPKGAMFNDKDLCSDMLATEKYVSSAYDTAIFECTSPAVRQVLNHIQKEEQEHGEQIFNYMHSHGMYSVQ